MPGQIIVFSDLDGSLLDHDTYAYDDALPALNVLRVSNIPLILCSSKTAAEMAPLRAVLGFADCAAIVENGAGILAPFAHIPEPAPHHARLLQIVKHLPAEPGNQFCGFTDWDNATLQKHTGLDASQAILAARRDYTEPGLWLGDDRARTEFIEILALAGVVAQQGGRFLTLGFATNKAQRMQEIVRTYATTQSGGVTSIALGDAPNDIDMLQQADYGIVIPNPAHAAIPKLTGESSGCIVRASEAGPAGWNATLLALLKKINQLDGD